MFTDAYLLGQLKMIKLYLHVSRDTVIKLSYYVRTAPDFWLLSAKMLAW